jgi:hypothetical protein
MKGFCVALQSLWANQTARRLLQRRLAEERRRGRGMAAALEAGDLRVHDLEATVRARRRQGATGPEDRRRPRRHRPPDAPAPPFRRASTPTPDPGPGRPDREAQGRGGAAGLEPAGRPEGQRGPLAAAAGAAPAVWPGPRQPAAITHCPGAPHSHNHARRPAPASDLPCRRPRRATTSCGWSFWPKRTSSWQPQRRCAAGRPSSRRRKPRWRQRSATCCRCACWPRPHAGQQSGTRR